MGSAGEMLIDAAGPSTTVTSNAPVLPSLVAVILAVPGAFAVTTPLPETVAILSSLDVQTKERP
jgi:hypothetical protein